MPDSVPLICHLTKIELLVGLSKMLLMETAGDGAAVEVATLCMSMLVLQVVMGVVVVRLHLKSLGFIEISA